MAAQPQQDITLKKLIWQDGPFAPEKMRRGTVATDGNTFYCNGDYSTSVHKYDSDSQAGKKWIHLADLPYNNSNLVLADNKLTSVGGKHYSGEATNSLLIFMGEGRDGKWIPHYPPMSHKRFNTAVVYSGHSLIVTGGHDGCNTLAVVEVLDVATQQWSTACSLPYPFTQATISICGERLYMLGGENQTELTHSVLTCSVSELLRSCQTQMLAGKHLSASANTVWQYRADTPYKASSCTILCGQLVVVGGIDENHKQTTAISAYDETTDSWKDMEAMKVTRSKALVATLPDNTMVVLGGHRGGRRSGHDIVLSVEIVKVL